MKPKFDFDDLYEDLMEHQKALAEGTDAKAVIKSLVDTSFGGDNESQMKAVQLLKGLATSDDPAANAFMKKLDSFTSKMSAGDNAGEKAGEKAEESIKTDLEGLKADSLKRNGKTVTLTWKGEGKSKADIEAAVASNKDKIKKIIVFKDGGKSVAEIIME
jgi:hypothetical protein